MSEQGKFNQTNLAIAAISASFAKTMNMVEPKFSAIFLEELEGKYREIRDMPQANMEALETLIWTKELIEKK